MLHICILQYLAHVGHLQQSLLASPHAFSASFIALSLFSAARPCHLFVIICNPCSKTNLYRHDQQQGMQVNRSIISIIKSKVVPKVSIYPLQMASNTVSTMVFKDRFDHTRRLPGICQWHPFLSVKYLYMCHNPDTSPFNSSYCTTKQIDI